MHGVTMKFVWGVCVWTASHSFRHGNKTLGSVTVGNSVTRWDQPASKGLRVCSEEITVYIKRDDYESVHWYSCVLEGSTYTDARPARVQSEIWTPDLAKTNQVVNTTPWRSFILFRSSSPTGKALPHINLAPRHAGTEVNGCKISALSRCELHALAALLPGNEVPVSVGWTPEWI